jgi:AmiR/NasT family two-component response regulator
MARQTERRAFEALEIGTVEEATVALARLFTVTEAALERSAQLQRALESRVVIEQAKGVLAERFGLDVEDAFGVLRRAARSHRVKVHDLARAAVTGPDTPPEIVAALEGSSRPLA